MVLKEKKNNAKHHFRITKISILLQLKSRHPFADSLGTEASRNI